jgi:hypothetical protein
MALMVQSGQQDHKVPLVQLERRVRQELTEQLARKVQSV